MKHLGASVARQEVTVIERGKDPSSEFPRLPTLPVRLAMSPFRLLFRLPSWLRLRHVRALNKTNGGDVKSLYFRDFSNELTYLFNRSSFSGVWSKRYWLNVPGPFYGAETDTCLGGPDTAPANILLTESGQEFVYRQPRDAEEFLKVLWAAYDDPCTGYGADGNMRWSVRLIRDWWKERPAAHSWIARARNDYAREYGDHVFPGLETLLKSLAEFEIFMSDPYGARAYLRSYGYFLEHHKAPPEGAKLPDIDR